MEALGVEARKGWNTHLAVQSYVSLGILVLLVAHPLPSRQQAVRGVVVVSVGVFHGVVVRVCVLQVLQYLVVDGQLLADPLHSPTHLRLPALSQRDNQPA